MYSLDDSHGYLEIFTLFKILKKRHLSIITNIHSTGVFTMIIVLAVIIYTRVEYSTTQK